MTYDVETDGAGAPPLAVPGLVWENPLRKYGPWRPPDRGPVPTDPRETARRANTARMRDEAVAQIDPGPIAAARAALDASARANAVLQRLEAEKATLDGDLSDQAALASVTIDRRIGIARKAVDQANRAVDTALIVMRQALSDAFTGIYTREYQAARALDQQAEQLEQQAGDLRLSVSTARGQLENYLPPVEISPVVEPPAASPALPKRKRLFS